MESVLSLAPPRSDKPTAVHHGHIHDSHRGAEYEVSFAPKVKIDVAIKDELLDQVIDAIKKAAATGKIGDGKIFVFDLGQATRVRTGETGEEAL